MLVSRAKLIRLVAFDVDGVMTDGGLYYSDSGEEFKRFNSLDGHGLKMLKASGVEIAIITGRTSRCVEARAKNLGIGQYKPRFGLDMLTSSRGLGDDVVDLTVMRHVGLSISVPESPQLVRDYSNYVTQRSGGHGAVREACELIMSAQGTLDAQLAPYLQ